MLTKIISGGQTGADQGALEAAVALGLATGGWMPNGWKTERGPAPDIAEAYGMREHPSADYPPRTACNVDEADGTIWVGTQDSRGFRATMREVRARHKPSLINPTPEDLRRWVISNTIRTLNVAGNRESLAPGTHARAMRLLLDAFK